MNPYLFLFLLLSVAAAIIIIEHFDFSKLKKFRADLVIGDKVTVDTGIERFNAKFIFRVNRDCRVMDNDMNVLIYPIEFIYPCDDETDNV